MRRNYRAEVIEYDSKGFSTTYVVRFTSCANTCKGLIRKAEHAMVNKYGHPVSVNFDDIMYRQAGKFKHMYHLVNLGWFQK